MTSIEWHIKTRQSKGGYYDCYKKERTRNEIEGQHNIIKQHVYQNIYWEKFVKEKDQNPQKEGAKLRKRWLLSGNNYRRMIEPLDIAKHYKKPLGVGEHHERPTKYLENRPDRYKLLESWLKEDQKDVKDVKRNKAPNLNEDSCFWAHVEEALISLNELKINANSSVDQENIKEFMDYVMHGIEEFLVSPDIFLEGSSLMTWWSEYESSETYKQGSSRSKFAQYMENRSYTSYK
ncbi:senescence-associated carboxylesterase 101-like [Bidens hawaiensis]|uniref:senescence-associated carboxylesterase 101-like n=1 Tax=Bidens hawaiensis TaxID=980011 RepID=UPI00404ACF50